MKASTDFSIGEVAERFGLATHVLRHWESAGLLIPDRDALDRRRYREEHLPRVALILMGKEAGFTLAQLRRLFSADSPMDEPELLRRHALVLERRITEAKAAKDLIDHALACPLDFRECEHARERIAARIPPPAPVGGQVECRAG